MAPEGGEVKIVVGDVEEDYKENLSRLTDCVLCGANLIDSYDDFVASKFIECCHSVCRDCVSKWDSAEKKSCPDCFLDVEKKLLDNFILQEIIDGNAMTKKATLCGVHTSNVTTHWCYGCGDSICEECIKYHSELKETQSHIIKTKEEHWSDPCIRYMCRSHPKEALKLFCLTCNVLTCRDCQLYDHRDHTYDFVSEIVDKAKVTLHKENVALRYHLKILESAMPMIQERKKIIEDQSEKITKEINDLAALLIAKITKKKHSLLSRLRAMAKSQMELLEGREKDVGEKMKSIKHSTCFTATVLKNSSDCSIVQSKDHILRHIDRIKTFDIEVPNPCCLKTLTFKDNTIDIVPGPRRPGPVQGTVGTVSLKDEIKVDLQSVFGEITSRLKIPSGPKLGIQIKKEIASNFQHSETISQTNSPQNDLQMPILQTLVQNNVTNNAERMDNIQKSQIGVTLERNNVNAGPNLNNPRPNFGMVRPTGSGIVRPPAILVKPEPVDVGYEALNKIDQMPLLNDLLQNNAAAKDFPVSQSVEELFNKNTQINGAKEQTKTIDDEIFQLLQGDEAPLDFGSINTNEAAPPVQNVATPQEATQSTSQVAQPIPPTTQNGPVGQIRPIQTSMLIKEAPPQNDGYLLKDLLGNQDYQYLNENQLRVLKPPPPYNVPIQPNMTWYRPPPPQPRPFLPSQFANRPVARPLIRPNIARPNAPTVRLEGGGEYLPGVANRSLLPCTVCLKPRTNVVCQCCKRIYHRNCSFFPSLKNYQNNQLQQVVPVTNCVLCDRIPMISKPYPFPMTLLELKVCSRVLVQLLVTRQSQSFYTNNPGGPTRLSGLKMKLFDKMEGFRGGVDEFVKHLKVLYQERYDRFKDKMTAQQLDMIYSVTLNVIKTFLPESIEDFSRYKQQ